MKNLEQRIADAKIGFGIVVACTAIRNKGTKAPITILFGERVKAAGNLSVAVRITAAGASASLSSARSNVDFKLTEDIYQTVFGGCDIPQEDQPVDLLNEGITADELFEKLTGMKPPKTARIRAIETVDKAVYANEDGTPKGTFQHKQAGENGPKLHSKGQPIYRSTEVDFEGRADVLIPHDEVLQGLGQREEQS